jgi:predicted LPLAT superfamily acyltransferase
VNQQVPAHADWARAEEKGNLAILKLMAWISLMLGRRVGRVVLAGIAAYYVLFAARARRASRQYLDRALGRRARWVDGYKHVFAFASTIHDRVYLLNDRFGIFDIQVVGGEQLLESLHRQPGAFLLGAHLGSFEVMRAVGRGLAGLKIAMMMYEENARRISVALAAINPSATPEIIPLGRVDSMLQVQERLDRGYLVGMLADRSLGGDPVVVREFLGKPASFPLGPFRLAAMLRRPVFFMVGLYLGGNRYRIHFEPLADFSATARAERESVILAAQARYVAYLERYCRLAPYNWFNFFDVWQR